MDERIIMTRKELAKRVTTVLKENNVKKPVMSPRQVFHISDDEGHTRDFVIKQTERRAIYTIDDVNAIIEAAILVAEESLKRGEPITFRGFGTLGLKYRKPRRTKKPGTDEWVEIAARYIPKFSFGDELRTCAKLYELSLGEKLAEAPLPEFEDDDIDEEDGV